MAQPSTRAEFTDYCLRKLGAPVLEINVDDDQVDDLIDDAIQFYQEYHFDGIEKMYLKHKLTDDDVERFKFSRGVSTVNGNEGGITFTISTAGSGYSLGSQTTTGGTGSNLTVDVISVGSGGEITGLEITNVGSGYTVGDVLTIGAGTGQITLNAVLSDQKWEDRNKYITVPDHVIGISKVFGVSSNWVRNDLFGLSNQYFLMDVFSFSSGFAFGNFDMSNYYMIRQYFETLDQVVNTGALVQYRFNKRQDRLYLDIDTNRIEAGDYLVIECYRVLDPATWTQVWNDSWLKRYTTALIKRQWGQNMIKFNNIQLPGGVTMNGRQLWEDGNMEIKELESKMISDYMLPPLDMIG